MIIIYYAQSLSAGPISSKLFHAIRMVETGGESDPENAVGDGGKAIGPYQIHDRGILEGCQQLWLQSWRDIPEL